MSYKSSSSVRARKVRKLCYQKHLCATFNLLCHEKRRLLYKADQRDKQARRDASLDEQMSNYDKRQHEVVQRMNAFDRYKRKMSQVQAHGRITAAIVGTAAHR